MKCSEWMEKLEKLAPKSLACEWDNPGLLAGRAEKEVKKAVEAGQPEPCFTLKKFARDGVTIAIVIKEEELKYE